MLRPLLPAADVELVFEPCDDIPPVYTDEGKVSQILRNFVSNALKFTEQGEVRVRAQYDAAQQLLTFSVSDTGIGIAPEHQQSVFEEFEQVENRLQTSVKGTGLGIAAMQQALQAVRRSGWPRERTGQRLDFHGNHSGISAADDRSRRRRRLALAMPSATWCSLCRPGWMTGCVTRRRYTTRVTGRPPRQPCAKQSRYWRSQPRPPWYLICNQGAKKAGPGWLSFARRKQPGMSVEGGPRSGADSHQRRVPVIVLSDIDQRERAQSLGADAFFIKPLSGNELLASLDAMLSAP